MQMKLKSVKSINWSAVLHAPGLTCRSPLLPYRTGLISVFICRIVSEAGVWYGLAATPLCYIAHHIFTVWKHNLGCFCPVNMIYSDSSSFLYRSFQHSILPGHPYSSRNQRNCSSPASLRGDERCSSAVGLQQGTAWFDVMVAIDLDLKSSDWI